MSKDAVTKRIRKISVSLGPVPKCRRHIDPKHLLSIKDKREGLGITVGFSTTNKLISRFIRWITGGRVSHAWIAFYDPKLDKRFVLQAEAWGYELRPWNRWLKENIWKAEFLLPQTDSLDCALVSISNYLGTDYDYKSAFLLGLRNWFGRWMKKPTNDPSKLMCSEAVIRFLGMTEMGSYGLNPELSLPSDLLYKMEADTNLIYLSSPV